MDTLPPELLTLILTHLPRSSLPQCHLVSHAFSALTFPLLFSHIPQWLDYATSHRAIISLAHDCNRPAVMWSPWASIPDGPVHDVFLGIVWRVLMKCDPPGLGGVSVSDLKRIGEEGGTGVGTGLTGANFKELSGREEMTENRLRTGQNRFLLFRADSCGRSGEGFVDGKMC